MSRRPQRHIKLEPELRDRILEAKLSARTHRDHFVCACCNGLIYRPGHEARMRYQIGSGDDPSFFSHPAGDDFKCLACWAACPWGGGVCLVRSWPKGEREDG